jgi:hypothetical protein
MRRALCSLGPLSAPVSSGKIARVLASSAVLISACLLSTASAKTAIEVTRWNAPGISSDQFESHAAFDPRGTDIYFVRVRIWTSGEWIARRWPARGAGWGLDDFHGR